MKEAFYKDLQHDFVVIRQLQYPNSQDEQLLHDTVRSVKEARAKISMHSVPSEKEILLYCIDTLLMILDEGDTQKIFDFADAIHNIPLMYTLERNFYSFRKEMNAFRKKYGKQYFPFLRRVKPRFTKKAPKNKWEFFSAKSDEDFKMLHPMGYKILCVIGIVALLLPLCVCTIYIEVINPISVYDWFVLFPYFLMCVGAFIVGTGLFNIVAAWIHQYMGHLLTVVCILGGGTLTLLSMLWLYA